MFERYLGLNRTRGTLRRLRTPSRTMCAPSTVPTYARSSSGTLRTDRRTTTLHSDVNALRPTADMGACHSEHTAWQVTSHERGFHGRITVRVLLLQVYMAFSGFRSVRATLYTPRRPLPRVSCTMLPIVKFVPAKSLLRMPSPFCAVPFSSTNLATSSSRLVPNTSSSCCFDGLPSRPCAPWFDQNTWKAMHRSSLAHTPRSIYAGVRTVDDLDKWYRAAQHGVSIHTLQ